MDSPQQKLDLNLWINSDLIQRQNLLKRQFTSLMEDVGNEFTAVELQQFSSNSRGAKLSKGNDLVGFPYLVLDLIRDFDQANGINIRILNWFGNGLYLSVFLGKNRKYPLTEILSFGLLFGLSENQWDYSGVILNGKCTGKESEIFESNLPFHHWIKEIAVDADTLVLKDSLTIEIKKILGILRIP